MTAFVDALKQMSEITKISLDFINKTQITNDGYKQLVDFLLSDGAPEKLEVIEINIYGSKACDSKVQEYFD